MSLSFRGTVVVTGASRGIGRAIVESLLDSKSYHVLGTARTEQALTDLAHKYGRTRFTPVIGDLCDTKTIDNVFHAVNSLGLPLCGIVHNAGILEPLMRVVHRPNTKYADSCTPEGVTESLVTTMRKAMEINYIAPIALTSRLMHKSNEFLRGDLCILFISTAAATGDFATQGWTSYCSSKGALLQFARCLATECNDRSTRTSQITVTSLGPGICDTDMQAVIRKTGQSAMDSDTWQFFYDKKDTMRPCSAIGDIVRRLYDQLLGSADVGASDIRGVASDVATNVGDRERVLGKHHALHGKYVEYEKMDAILSTSGIEVDNAVTAA